MIKQALGFHIELDHCMLQVPYLTQWIERAADWGYTHILFEGGDKYPFQTHPGLRNSEAFTKKEFETLLQTCRDLKLTIIPLVQSLAHVENLLTKPGYEKYRAKPDIKDHYKPVDEQARKLIIELIDDIIEQTQPEEWIHIGGDEAKRIKDCAKAVGKDPGTLYLEHMLPIFEHVRKRGLRPIIWTDMVLTYPDILDSIPKDVIMCDWEYDIIGKRSPRHRVWGKGFINWETYEQFDHDLYKRHFELYAVDQKTPRDGKFVSYFYTDALLDRDFDVLTAPATRCSGDTAGISNLKVRMPNCFDFGQKGMTQALGAIVTSWGGRGNHLETSLPSEFAGLQGANQKGAFDEQQAFLKFTEKQYGAAIPGFGKAAMQASSGVSPFSSHHLGMGRRAECKGDHMEEMEKNIVRRTGGLDLALAKLDELKAGYIDALQTFEESKALVKRNSRNLDFWIEGTNLNLFSCDILKAACQKTLDDAGTRQRFRERLQALKKATRELFQETFSPRAVETQLSLRYDFYTDYLAELEGIASMQDKRVLQAK